MIEEGFEWKVESSPRASLPSACKTGLLPTVFAYYVCYLEHSARTALVLYVLMKNDNNDNTCFMKLLKESIR